MKKFVCLLIVVTMVLALGITAYARYEGCPDCETRLIYGDWIEDEDLYYCEFCEDEVEGWYECSGEYCPKCNIGQYYESSELVLSCGH